MQIVQIKDPRDWTYPFAQSLYDDHRVVYHGTSSTFSDTIESSGFVLGKLPFSIQALRKLISLAEEIRFHSWSYTTVKGLSSNTQLSSNADRPIYFSANFWFARDYATSIGGETIHNAILLSEQLLAHIHRASEDYSSVSFAVRQIHKDLLALTAGAFPVVYAVQVEPEWLQHESSLERQQIGSLVVTKVNIGCFKSVPLARLIAKVEYVNGAEPGYIGPQPVTWSEARRFLKE